MVGVNKKRSEKLSIPLSAFWGTAIAVVVALIASCVLSYLIISGKIKEENMEIGVCIALFIASCVGCLVSAGFAKERLALQMLISTASYICTMLVFNITIFGARFSNILSNVLAVIVGGFVATLLLAGKGRKKRHR